MTENQLTYEELQTNAATQAHINLVQKLMRLVVTELLKRAEDHDKSKFSPEELKVFTEYTSKLRHTTYGSEEYKECLKEMKPALEHHYLSNRHHPEFHENGIDGMNLVDLIEMFVDWLASTKCHEDGNILRSINVNTERFKMGPQLVNILKNTALNFPKE
jgi:hypothetical protein